MPGTQAQQVNSCTDLVGHQQPYLAHRALGCCCKHAEQEGHFIREAELGACVGHVLQQRVAHGGGEEQHLHTG